MQQQKGFSLIEVLVTMVVISFGMLGIAGVIVNSLKNNQSAYARSQASVLANDIIDRMRANRTTAEDASRPYNFNNLTTTETPSGSGVVLNDLTEWSTSLARSMPSGRGSIAIDATNKVTVIVQWDDSRASTDARGTDAEIQAARADADPDAPTKVGKVAQQITVETRL
jgi:type IV pilus assembly protein PilV